MKRSRKKKRARQRGGGSAIVAGRLTRWTPVPPNSLFIDETLAFWQPRAQRQLTREDAREIIENVAGFFSVLLEWDAAEREVAAAQGLSLEELIQRERSVGGKTSAA
ncbi:MAG: hypothetical protein WDO17_15620 [Alphaproteobacteria bacterium]